MRRQALASCSGTLASYVSMRVRPLSRIWLNHFSVHCRGTSGYTWMVNKTGTIPSTSKWSHHFRSSASCQPTTGKTKVKRIRHQNEDHPMMIIFCSLCWNPRHNKRLVRTSFRIESSSWVSLSFQLVRRRILRTRLPLTSPQSIIF